MAYITGEDYTACACLERVKNSEWLCWHMSDVVVASVELGVLTCVATEGRKFPDFVFEGGFIEHFQVTASAEEAKRSVFHREFEKFEVEFESELITVRERVKPGEFETHIKHFPPIAGSHTDLVLSFKRVWSRHIKSLLANQPYAGQKSVFLIEFPMALSLCMWELVPEGSYIKPRKSISYRLGFDIELLRYIKSDSHLVQYVIFETHKGIEVIDTSKIDTMLEALPYPFDIKPRANFTMGLSSIIKLEQNCD